MIRLAPDLSQELRGHVVLPTLDVDVGKEEPAALQVISVLKVPAVLGHTLELIPEQTSDCHY